jgi:hypothetical protein
VKFFNDRSGTERMVGGGYLDSAGRVESLDILAKEFLAAAPESTERQELLTKIEAAVAEESGKSSNAKEFGKFYALAAKAVQSGKELTKEVERLTRMLAGNVALKARAALHKRINIAKQFIAQA